MYMHIIIVTTIATVKAAQSSKIIHEWVNETRAVHIVQSLRKTAARAWEKQTCK